MPFNISEINQNGGVCGFVSMLQFIIDHNALSATDAQDTYGNQTVMNANFAKEWFEIQSQHDKALAPNRDGSIPATALNQSFTYTKTFSGFQNTTKTDVENYLTQKGSTTIKGFALTPEAICDYLDRRYGFRMMIDKYEGTQNQQRKYASLFQPNCPPGIYGVALKVSRKADFFPQGTPDDYLGHWVYVDKKGQCMTWGKAGDAAKVSMDNLFDKAIIRLYAA